VLQTLLKLHARYYTNDQYHSKYNEAGKGSGVSGGENLEVHTIMFFVTIAAVLMLEYNIRP
jgi:hypothetical protein